MKYLQINSEFIDREFNKMLQDAIRGIKSNVSDSRSKGELDCVMSTFGKRLDEFTENYVIDHIKVSRKFKYKDVITPEVLRVLNTYKKIGVHKMFEKLYPKAFIKQQLRRNPLSGLSTSDIKSRIVTVLHNLNAWRSNGASIDEAVNRLQVLLSELGIRNISDYFDNVGVDIIKSSSSLTALYVKVNNSSYDSLITAIRAGSFNLMDNYGMDDVNYLDEKIKIDGDAATQYKRHLETAAVRYFTMSGATIPAPTPEEEAPRIVRRSTGASLTVGKTMTFKTNPK